MSRIGKEPIEIVKDVEVQIKGQSVLVKGPKGELSQDLEPCIEITQEDDRITLKPLDDSRETGAKWGLYRALLANMVKGVTEGWEKKLQIEGVGYRAALQGDKLVLNLGYSHPIEIEAPEGISFDVDKNKINVMGADKQLVGHVAAKIKFQRKPDAYKGKGIRYEGEEIRLKAGKKTGSE